MLSTLYDFAFIILLILKNWVSEFPILTSNTQRRMVAQCRAIQSIGHIYEMGNSDSLLFAYWRLTEYSEEIVSLSSLGYL